MPPNNANNSGFRIRPQNVNNVVAELSNENADIVRQTIEFIRQGETIFEKENSHEQAIKDAWNNNNDELVIALIKLRPSTELANCLGTRRRWEQNEEIYRIFDALLDNDRSADNLMNLWNYASDPDLDRRITNGELSILRTYMANIVPNIDINNSRRSSRSNVNSSDLRPRIEALYTYPSNLLPISTNTNSLIQSIAGNDLRLFNSIVRHSRYTTDASEIVYQLHFEINGAWDLRKMELAIAIIKFCPMAFLITSIIVERPPRWTDVDMIPIFDAFLSHDDSEENIIALWRFMHDIHNERRLTVAEKSIFRNYVRLNFPNIILPELSNNVRISNNSQNNSRRNSRSNGIIIPTVVRDLDSLVFGLTPRDKSVFQELFEQLLRMEDIPIMFKNVLNDQIRLNFEDENYDLAVALIKFYPSSSFISSIITLDSDWYEADMVAIFDAFLSQNALDTIERKILELWRFMHDIHNRRDLADEEEDIFRNYIHQSFRDIVIPEISNNSNNSNISRNNNNSRNNSGIITDMYNEIKENVYDGDKVYSSKCSLLLVDVDKLYKRENRLMVKICDSINSYKLVERNNVVNLRRGTVRIIAESEDPVKSLIKTIYSKRVPNMPLLLSDLEVKYKSANGQMEEGAGEGVTRDYISTCIKILLQELLEPVNKQKNNNSNSKNNYGFYNIKKNLDLTDNLIKRKLTALGYILGFMVLNDIPLEVDIKRSVIHMCLFQSDPKEDISYLVYELVEDPDANLGIKNSLKDASSIDKFGLDFEDIGMKSRKVTKDNYIEYLKAKNEHDNIPKGVKYVSEGINKRTGVGKVLLKKGVNVYRMYEILCDNRMKKEDIEVFIRDQLEFINIPNDIKEWFQKILLESDLDFIKNLLYFWGSTYNPVKNKSYQVLIGERVISGTVCPLPQARTCFYQLVLPQGINSKDQMKDILSKSIGYVGKGMLLYGGRRRRRGVIKTKK
jgi:hypothetical protein